MIQRYRNYEIEASDDNNYTLSVIGVAKKGKNVGEETMSVIGYFNSIEAVVNKIARICGNEAEDLNKWLEEYRKVKKEFEEILLQ